MKNKSERCELRFNPEEQEMNSHSIKKGKEPIMMKKASVIFILMLAALFLISFSGACFAAVSCTSTTLRTIPINPAATGPWPVGSKSLTISGYSAEIWYPAVPGSQSGLAHDTFCMSDYIPGLTGDRTIHTYAMDSYPNLPLDTSYGKYPVLILVHGTGSFKYASHVNCAHWAGRGFVVISIDNPHIYIKDVLENAAGLILADQSGDTKKILSAVKYPTGSLAFLRGRIDTNRIGLLGHSAGGAAIASLGSQSGVRVIIPMASPLRVQTGLYVQASLHAGGLADQIATWSAEQLAYGLTSISNKRLVGVPDAGHMVFTNVCDSVAKAAEYGVDLSGLSDVANDGCGSEYIDQETGWEIVNYATTAVLEETLQCNKTSSTSINAISSVYSGVVYKAK